ncbi:NADH-quinone oxidoreductase subunit J [Rubrivirga sp. S365]|uniref:NADH-quinone oxidoreductase subunit J n=1 Tax=Rubrivirga litoralis TaxID=3075598 RepID=A0ABU3BNL0_9BACT|nr:MULTISPECIES: NADH-quinone oxidoreductase subunit J [unclassified Rubrivirga]MDT0630877.1 NADH-quinone oxidoreductase subunit J [Rubrivirga sp. F394]MDT7857429.1 NADH-quinone oxidoreductase subunit J [Rubrivirga sp. S365]
MLELFLFFVFAVFAVAGAVGMLVSRSPVASALWMVQTMLALACLYLTLNATFIGVVQVLVYAGAIMVLFLFVIMLLNLEEAPTLSGFSWARAAAFVAGVGVLALLLAVVSVRLVGLPDAPVAAEPVVETSVVALGVALLTRHAFSLEIIAALLLAATIGAVLLAKKRFV